MNKELKAFLKYYAYLINNQLEYIKGLEKYNIDNQELEDHYDLLSGYMQSANNKIIEIYNK